MKWVRDAVMVAEGKRHRQSFIPPSSGVRRELFEAAELAKAESPGTFADAVPVDHNIRTWI